MFISCSSGEGQEKGNVTEEIKLPPPQKSSKISLEEALAKRRSTRKFDSKELTMEEIGQLLWAADGLNADAKVRTNRTAPSAGAIYPMELYAVTKEGVYHYALESHSLKLIKKGEQRTALAKASLGQKCVETAPLNIIITGNIEKCAHKYKERATRYVDIEAGHIAQNIHLQTVALTLGSVPVGAFDDDEVKKVLQIPEPEIPLYIIPVGHPQK